MIRAQVRPLFLLLAFLAVGCQQTARPMPVNCQQILASSHVLGNYQKVSNELAQGVEPLRVYGAQCFLDPASIGKLSAHEAYEALVAHVFNADILYSALRQSFRKNLRLDRSLGVKRDAGLAWPGMYLAEASLVAYQRTGQQRFLDLFVDYYDAVLLRRDDQLGRFDVQHRRVMKAWGSVNIEAGQWIAHVTHNARIVYPATEFARIVRSSPSLNRYEAKAEHYLLNARETMAEFDADMVSVPGYPGISWYRRPFDANLEATNHLHVIGTVWLNLAALTGDPVYRQRVGQLINVFVRGVRRESDGLVSWSYFPFFAIAEQKDPEFLNGQEYSEPLWKASLTSPFLLRAFERGYAMPKSLVPAMGRVFTTLSFQGEQIWRNVARRDSRFVDVDRDRQKLGFLKNVVTLVEYGKIVPHLPEQIAHVVAGRRDFFPQGWLSSPATLLGYAYYLGR